MGNCNQISFASHADKNLYSSSSAERLRGIDSFQSTLSTVETNDKNSNMFAICKVETLSDRSSKIPTTREHSIDPFRFIINFLIISMSQVNWYFFSPRKEHEREAKLHCRMLIPPIRSVCSATMYGKPIRFYLLFRRWIPMLLPKITCTHCAKLERKRRRKTKKVNFIELPVIYLIFVFIMFHLLSNSFGRGLANSKCRAWTFNIIAHCSL